MNNALSMKPNIQNKKLDTIAYQAHGNLYLNITNRCNLKCNFCPKYNRQWIIDEQSLILHKEPTVDEIISAIGDPSGYEELVFCGLGEPSLRVDTVLEVAHYLKSKNCFVRLNTNGLANREYKKNIAPELAQCIDAMSISLNAQDEIAYDYHCRPKELGAYYEMRDFITCAIDSIKEVTLTAIDGLQGIDISACENIAKGYGIKFKRRVYNIVG